MSESPDKKAPLCVWVLEGSCEAGARQLATSGGLATPPHRTPPGLSRRSSCSMAACWPTSCGAPFTLSATGVFVTLSHPRRALEADVFTHPNVFHPLFFPPRVYFVFYSLRHCFLHFSFIICATFLQFFFFFLTFDSFCILTPQSPLSNKIPMLVFVSHL